MLTFRIGHSDVFGFLHRQLHLITNGTCDSNGFSSIIGPGSCNFAMHAHLELDNEPGVENPTIANLHGPSGCEVGTNGVNYGTCAGEDTTKPAGCSIKDGIYNHGKNINSNTGDGTDCSTHNQCLCTDGNPSSGESAYSLDSTEGFSGLDCPTERPVLVGSEFSWAPGSGMSNEQSSHRWEICINAGIVSIIAYLASIEQLKCDTSARRKREKLRGHRRHIICSRAKQQSWRKHSPLC